MKPYTAVLILLATACGERHEPAGTKQRKGNLGARVPVPEFTFLEARDRPLSRSDLMGKVWTCAMIFTSCTTYCPPMAGEMADLQEEFEAEADFRILAVTVDPANDTPEVMREFLKLYGGKKDRWFFVTGKRADIVKFANEGIKLGGDPQEPLTHSFYFALVDKKGRVRDYYSQTDRDRMKTLRADIRTLLAE